MQVFLSVGRQETDKHRKFVAAIISELEVLGIKLVSLQNTYENPLDKITEELRRSSGCLVVCFERTFATAASEFRNVPSAKRQIKPFVSSTTWNHMETAMARALGKPILVIAEKGCHVDGVLDPVVRLKVQWLDFDEPSVLQRPDIRKLIAGWIDTMKQVDVSGEELVAVDDLTVLQIAKSLRFSHIGGIFIVLTGIFGAAFWLGQLWQGLQP